MSICTLAHSPKQLCLDELVAYVRKNKGEVEFVFRFDYALQVVMATDWKLYTNMYKVQNHLSKCKIGDPIIFIPESPHKAEFFDDPMKCFNQPDVCCRPLNGKDVGSAGYLFRKYGAEMFAKILADKVMDDSKIGAWHPVIVANACRFQCSLGKPIVDNARDINFLSCILGNDPELNGDNLIKRIEDYSPHYLVVCACTMGGLMLSDSKGHKKKDVSAINDWLISNSPDIYERVGEISLRGVVEQILQNAGVSFVQTTHPCLWYSSKYRVVRTVGKKSRKRSLPKKKGILANKDSKGDTNS